MVNSETVENEEDSGGGDGGGEELGESAEGDHWGWARGRGMLVHDTGGVVKCLRYWKCCWNVY